MGKRYVPCLLLCPQTGCGLDRHRAGRLNGLNWLAVFVFVVPKGGGWRLQGGRQGGDGEEVRVPVVEE